MFYDSGSGMLVDILISDYINMVAFSDSLSICACQFSLICLQSAETVGHSYTYADNLLLQMTRIPCWLSAHISSSQGIACGHIAFTTKLLPAY